MKRFLIAGAALAASLLPLAAHADTIDEQAFETRGQNVAAQIRSCRTPDPNEVWQLEVQANELARYYAGVANATPGVFANSGAPSVMSHEMALQLYEHYNATYNQLAHPVIPDSCYVPPAS